MERPGCRRAARAAMPPTDAADGKRRHLRCRVGCCSPACGWPRAMCPARSPFWLQAEAFVRQHNFVFRMPDVAAAQVLTVAAPGRSGGGRAAGRRPTTSPSARPASTWPRATRPQPWRCWSQCASRRRPRVGRMNGSRCWCSRRSRSTRRANTDQAVQLLGEALALAEPGGFIRIFVDEGRADGAAIVRGRRARHAGRTISGSCWPRLPRRAARPAGSRAAAPVAPPRRP